MAVMFSVAAVPTRLESQSYILTVDVEQRNAVSSHSNCRGCLTVHELVKLGLKEIRSFVFHRIGILRY